jgi:hypothetical protein
MQITDMPVDRLIPYIRNAPNSGRIHKPMPPSPLSKTSSGRMTWSMVCGTSQRSR